MVELQLEKLSPIPVTQVVWSVHPLPPSRTATLQTVIVMIVERKVVEEFLGQLEGQGIWPTGWNCACWISCRRHHRRRRRVDLSRARWGGQQRGAGGLVVWRRAAESQPHHAAGRNRAASLKEQSRK